MSMYYYDNSQHIFDRALGAILALGKGLLKALVYLPIWFCGYLISTTFLQKEDSVWAWLAATVIIALVIYQLLFFVKGLMIGWKMQKNVLWVILFIICCVFSCVAPAVILWYVIEPVMIDWTKNAAGILSWMISIAFGCWVYTRYHFLTNIAPAAAFPVYQLGINCAIGWTNLTSSMSAKKSGNWI